MLRLQAPLSERYTAATDDELAIIRQRLDPDARRDQELP